MTQASDLDIKALEAAIASRRSVRRFRPEPVAVAHIADLLRAATRAPSAHNRQPWRFRIVAESTEKAMLAKAMGDRLRADRNRDGDDPELIRQDVERSSARLNGAPVLIAVCLTLEDMDRYPDARRTQAEYLMAVQSTAMAAQLMLLKAEATGLGACWVCAPLFCPDIVASALALPQTWQPQGLILLGWPAEPGRMRDRKPVSDIARGMDL